VRRELAGAAHDATHFANELARKDAEDSLEAMRRSGRTSVIALTSAEKALWRRALMPVHREAGERIEPEVLHAMYRETGFVPE
jgi:C4-dicarboxylate-binding protein DctP